MHVAQAQDRVYKLPCLLLIADVAYTCLAYNYYEIDSVVTSFTLCTYAQQDYVWSRWFVYIDGQNWLFEVLLLGNLSLVQSTARSSCLTTKKGAYYPR